ncbi:uncharacterized protein [Gossypium hirsutum]|uniref:Integrase zinc-binding domain-containing protein n=1 Tax=Gossypium hirsutum TaxID=3635 RepID=A0ABM3BJE4_GOSHI|nr:uncharacterized protein LOC121228070 [Gossypium hirsutum]
MRFHQVETGTTIDFGLNNEGVLCFRDRICVLNDEDLRLSILREAHSSLYAIHPSGNKMYKALRELYCWEEYLLLAEFAYYNSYQSCIQMAPYEAPYGHKCRTPLCWTELGERRVLGPKLVSETEDKVYLIRDRLKTTSNRQKSYADLKMKDIEHSVEDLVFLKVSPWKKVLRFGLKSSGVFEIALGFNQNQVCTPIDLK